MHFIKSGLQYSETLLDDNHFNGFVLSNNLTTNLDQNTNFMYDIDNKKYETTKNKKTYYLTASEAKWLDTSLHDKSIEYVLNNHGHRSDDFENISKEKNSVLFAGCSTTFGQGIPLDYSWPKILFDKLKNYIDIEKFYCISFPGASTFRIIENIFRFCYLYGTPKNIFVLLPDYMRQDRYQFLDDKYEKMLLEESDEDRENFKNQLLEYKHRRKIQSGNSHKLKERESSFIFDQEGFFMMYCAINMLKTFCLSNNIHLYMSTWDELSNKRMSQLNIERYYDLKYYNAQPYYDDMINKSDIIKEKYLDVARDGMHPGKLVHSYTADMFLKYFLEEHND